MGRPRKPEDEKVRRLEVYAPAGQIERADARLRAAGQDGLVPYLRQVIAKHGGLEFPTPPSGPMPPKVAAVVSALQASVNQARDERAIRAKIQQEDEVRHHEHRADGQHTGPIPKCACGAFKVDGEWKRP